MGHNHNVYDTDVRFKINPVTRIVKGESSKKTSLSQFDHKSEVFGFEIPRYIEGHDMSLCNKVEVHYINIDSETKEENKGLYKVTDLRISEENEETVVFTWEITENSTQLVGVLAFLITFKCKVDDEITYRWSTAINKDISISNGMNNGDVVEKYADILTQWENELFGLEDSIVKNIEKKVEDVIKSIPEDYTALDGKTKNVSDTVEKYLVSTNINLFNPNNVSVGFYYDPFSDRINEQSSYIQSEELIPFEVGSVYRTTFDVSWFPNHVSFWDENKNKVLIQGLTDYVTSVDNRYKEFCFPKSELERRPVYANAKYIKFAFYGEKVDEIMIIKDHEYPSEYIAYGKEYSKKLNDYIKELFPDFEDISHTLTLLKEPFYKKTILFSGDSISQALIVNDDGTYGVNRGWPEIIQENNPHATVKNYGVGGTTISKRNGTTDSILERLETMYSKHPNADYVILQGGVNDCYANVPLGEISTGYKATLDETTFCGAMESLLKNAILKWKGKKIGFIITFKVPTADYNNFEKYMSRAKSICEKWSVPYIDLYNNSGLEYHMDEIKNSYSYEKGGLHPNVAGYEIITPKIESWLKTL